MTTTPLPPGAASCDQWEDDTRTVTSPPRTLPDRPDVFILVTGIQHRDGSIDSLEQPPLVVVDGASSGLTARQARALALRLLEAANDAEAWLQ